ncbi:glutamate synthase-related protein [Shimia marina]|uniref:Glutamate synthase [NADPH] large chain n=1 Tax=Shimia marina TaxID=321267 RepID=A0A0P1F8J9_9RHOB|nr:glutamate synthase-related protein [Shimia marina]CUH50730.1 Glutamate synthase [NADPH] large chain [Shimia marina]SFE35656.1 glutamate synthase (NADPH/NADH) large chain [Shimia marina]
MQTKPAPFGLYDPDREQSSCGVGFLTRKDGRQTHDVLKRGHEALCAVPHRGGMSSEGVGDGAGVSVDLSVPFFRKLTGIDLAAGQFGVGNFFLPADESQHDRAAQLIETALGEAGFETKLIRNMPVNNEAIGARAVKCQLPIAQWVFVAPKGVAQAEFDRRIHVALLAIEAEAYTDPALEGLYPLSLSSRMQVFKGRLNSWEIIPYFADLMDPDHAVHTLYFHTRFSTNTDPHPSMAQPFRLMAHNGELNTDKKNRLSEAAIALARNKAIVRPKGQSDSCRLDQTLNARVYDEGLDLVTAVVAMMPPAWENDSRVSPDVRAMLEYFSLSEEKNDGPAALVFGDGNIIGARLDRLGLRPMRSVETHDYLAVMSEAGQIDFPPEEVLRRGRVEAGGMIYLNHAEGRIYETEEALQQLAQAKDYAALLAEAQVNIDDLPVAETLPADAAARYDGDLVWAARYVGYTLNQESFKFLMDPMLQTGVEKVSAMGYGNAINALSDNEGGVAKYFSQRFAQVTNPPLDSIREADGMTLRVALGEKPHLGQSRARQIVVNSPVLLMTDVLKIKAQTDTPWAKFDILYTPVFDNGAANEASLTDAIDAVADAVVAFAREQGGIAILTDRHLSRARAPMPMTLAISAINQRLIEEGMRFKASLVVESGQICSSHHISCALGFGASAVYPMAVRMRAEELYGTDAPEAYRKFKKAAEKALMKTMGKVGLCTVESYSGGEFFEPNFLDTNDPVFAKYLPNMKTPVGGVRFDVVANSVADWHARALTVESEKDIPILGLFKERAEGAGHSYGTTAVRGFVDLTEEKISFDAGTDGDDGSLDGETDPFRLMTLRQMDDAFGVDDKGYVNTSFEKLSKEKIDGFKITPGYRAFSAMMAEERHRRPAALRDVLSFPADITFLDTVADMKREMMLFNRAGNNDFVIRGVEVEALGEGAFLLRLTGPKAQDLGRLDVLAETLVDRFGTDVEGHYITKGALKVSVTGMALDYVSRMRPAPALVELADVQPASEITGRLASGAMSHGALVASAHEAVAHGTNMVGGMSNSGEGGEHITRYGTIRASRIKQFASGRFGVWAGYLADPNLEEIEIKIGQGAKPGEGGQLPAPKVTVEIAAARGGTPGVELISPPPHHDTYSIEDLGQLIHDAKAARVRVIVKLVSSEGIGTIAVGVAKAGADVINIAGNTGGTGAAAVTSLKYTGRAAEIGIAEVHQALCANGIRQKVLLRCSGAMQTGSDVVKGALLGGDSFEFGTTALMMLKCVMAKNCNVKCPAGLTTNPEVFDGDPRALAQYLLNIAHEVREILAVLGLTSLEEARGRSDLLHLLDHPSSVGKLDLRAMLTNVAEIKVENPIYLEKDFSVDDALLDQVKSRLIEGGERRIELRPNAPLNNRNKTVGGQLGVDIERLLNHELAELPIAAHEDVRGRRYLDPRSIHVQTHGSAGQSFGAFCNDGMVMEHTGTCNDGVGKGASGGEIIVRSPGGAKGRENVLIGNFALFGATGGRTFVEGQAGDRFAVRNSGATAVVEGVGDFCAEYMTNGAILNIGEFAKGFGNGMSGGFAYQYDPQGRLNDMISKDSVLMGTLVDGSDHARIHEEAVRQMLTWHVEATGSAKGQDLLGDWENTRSHMAWIMPKALLQYQDADAILAARSRKELMDELASALAAHQIAELKKAWKHGRPVHRGAVPAYGEMDTDEMFRLLGSYIVLEQAQVIAAKRVKTTDRIARDKAARNLILTEDFGLMAALAKHAKASVETYDDAGLAALVANKRLSDFKRALSLRNILSMDSPGTYAWILHQSAKNRAALGEVPSFDALFAENAIPDVIARTASE